MGVLHVLLRTLDTSTTLRPLAFTLAGFVWPFAVTLVGATRAWAVVARHFWCELTPESFTPCSAPAQIDAADLLARFAAAARRVAGT